MNCQFCGQEMDDKCSEDDLMCSNCLQSEMDSHSLTNDDYNRIDRIKFGTSRDRRYEFYGESGYSLEDISFLEGHDPL